MKKVYLLKPYQQYGASEIIEVSNNVAFGLIDQGVARNVENRDFLVKPQFGETKAFVSSPSGINKVKRVK